MAQKGTDLALKRKLRKSDDEVIELKMLNLKSVQEVDSLKAEAKLSHGKSERHKRAILTLNEKLAEIAKPK